MGGGSFRLQKADCRFITLPFQSAIRPLQSAIERIPMSIRMTIAACLAAIPSVMLLAQPPAQPPAQPQPMSFFVTSVGKGDGANLGGLTGADSHCQTLAAAAGRG